MNHIIDEYNKIKYTEWDKILNEFSNKDIFEAVILYYLGKGNNFSYREIASMTACGDKPNELLSFIYYWITYNITNGNYNFEYEGYVTYSQIVAQIKCWKKSKQEYNFDKDFISELLNTNNEFSIPQNVFEYLPHNTFYLDYSQNTTVCEKIGIDGILVTVQKGTIYDGHQDINMYWIYLLNYKGGEYQFTTSFMIKNESFETTVDKLAKSYGYGVNWETYYVLLLQCLLYLCSYEPDIRETPSSKQRHRQAKQNKKTAKDELPERENAVGERFGNAFRKWSKSTVGGGAFSEPTGRHNRPHIRKAHWHSFWIGKHDTPERRIVIKWVSETFCGLKENEANDRLDVVKHKVNKTAASPS